MKDEKFNFKNKYITSEVEFADAAKVALVEEWFDHPAVTT